MKTYKWLIFFLILFSGELSAQGFVVDHTCIDENDTVIPMEYLNAARQLDITFGHNSIGGDVTHGMEFLRDQVNSSRYDLTIIESYHSGDGIDLPAPEWFDSNSGIVGWRVLSNDNPWDKRDNFSDHIALYGSRVDVAMMKYGHLDQNDGESPTQLFERLRDDIEDLESDYPNVVFVWWTMPVTAASYCGSSNQTRYEYNTLVRQYVSEHNKVLLDIADIEGHAPDGSPVYDGDCDVMYPEYAQEDNVHLRPHDETSGAPRLARAMWWLMARLAGWDPDGGGETLTLDWPDPPNAYSWDGSWSPSASQLPPDGLFDDVYYDGHLVDGEPSPILPQGDWDWVNPNNGDVSELANWNGFESGTGHFDPLLDSQGNQFGWRLIGNSSDIEMTSTSYKGSDGVDIVDYGENGSIHSTASIRFQDGPDMIRYTQSWSIGWRVGSDIDGYDNDNDLVIAGYDAIQSPGEFPIQTSGVHTGPGNDLVFMKDMTRSMVDLGNGNDGSTDSIDQHDGDDIIVADGNWLDNRVMGGGGDDIFFWYVDNNRPDNSWTGGRFLGTGSFGDAIWGDDT
ncbi:MAG: hypothetical protein B6244_12070 [Candidatus Cloacimonetes bacterium 4572_55]|nr:MAG: hypothetical protein B6244_12070 [Candidatus Cloacimonetes bacterium 4572_55]